VEFKGLPLVRIPGTIQVSYGFMLKFDIITIFPDMFKGYLQESMLKIAQQKKKVKINIHDLRRFTTDKHRRVDDRPYGGGPGMILKVEPLYRALKTVARTAKAKRKIILLDAGGKLFNQATAKKFAKLEQIVLIAGRYEGVDERVKKFIDERVSIGEYVLTGGELPAMVVVDAVARLLPGVIGHADALREETYTRPAYIEYPQYTRPEVFKVGGRSLVVPKILTSGDHAKIKAWRLNKKKSA